MDNLRGTTPKVTSSLYTHVYLCPYARAFMHTNDNKAMFQGILESTLTDHMLWYLL